MNNTKRAKNESAVVGATFEYPTPRILNQFMHIFFHSLPTQIPPNFYQLLYRTDRS